MPDITQQQAVRLINTERLDRGYRFRCLPLGSNNKNQDGKHFMDLIMKPSSKGKYSCWEKK